MKRNRLHEVQRHEQPTGETRKTQPTQWLTSAQLLDLLKGEAPEDVRATSELAPLGARRHLP